MPEPEKSALPPWPGEGGRADAYAAWRFRDFRLIVVAGFVGSVGSRMVDVAVGWELYERTGSALALGLVGLAQIVPALLLALPAGQVADRFNRQRIAVATTLLLALAATGLALISSTEGPTALVYACLAVIGAADVLHSPATASMLAQAVPAERFGNAAAWQSSVGQAASIGGPALGGLGIALTDGATAVYVVTAAALVATAPLLAGLRLGRSLGQAKRSRANRCWPGCASSGRRRRFWRRVRSISSRCCSAGRRRYCRSSPRTCWRSDRAGSVGSGRRRRRVRCWER